MRPQSVRLRVLPLQVALFLCVTLVLYVMSGDDGSSSGATVLVRAGEAGAVWVWFVSMLCLSCVCGAMGARADHGSKHAVWCSF